MSYEVRVNPKDRYLHVKVSGDNTPGNVRAYLKDVYDACAKAGVHAVLIEEDLKGKSLDPADVYRIILESSARTAPVIRKIAYIDINPEHSNTIIDLGEAVARDQGVNILTFSTVAAAAEWLESESSASKGGSIEA